MSKNDLIFKRTASILKMKYIFFFANASITKVIYKVDITMSVINDNRLTSCSSSIVVWKCILKPSVTDKLDFELNYEILGQRVTTSDVLLRIITLKTQTDPLQMVTHVSFNMISELSLRSKWPSMWHQSKSSLHAPVLLLMKTDLLRHWDILKIPIFEFYRCSDPFVFIRITYCACCWPRIRQWHTSLLNMLR